jgi:polyisoprenoid-binding protein YceI
MSRRARWLIAVPVALVVLVVGGTWLYINVFRKDAPAALTFDTSGTTVTSAATDTSATAATGPFALAGTWKATSGSTVGYRISEILFGQKATAVGRTSAVAGDLVVDGTTLRSTSLTVDMTTMASDSDRRDSAFHGRIMNTSRYPTATFTLTAPITALPAAPADKTELSYRATGDLTMHGVTKSVTFTLKARRSGATLEVNGAIPITFADWGIDNPSGGPAQTGDNGTLEFLVKFARA